MFLVFPIVRFSTDTHFKEGIKILEDNFYSKIPNKLFYSNTDNEDSILKTVNHDVKVLLILDYLYTNTNRRNSIKFTLEDMILTCWCTPDQHKNRTNDQFKNILSILCSKDYLQSDCSFASVKPSELLCCTLNIDMSFNYTELYESEKLTIFAVNSEDKKIDRIKLLMYFCYLKSRMYRRPKDDDLSAHGGRAETTWISFEFIAKDIGLTDETIKKYNDLLVELNLIRMGNAGLWYYSDDKNKIVRESPNFYALFHGNETETKDHLKESIKYFKSLDKNSNKVFVNSRNYKNNNRSLNGQLGAIIKKENSGTATEQDILIKNQILESKNADSEVYKIKSLLEANPNETLSLIYSAYNENLADKYYNLELALGLMDTEGNLLVDRKYYFWVMTNYQESNKDYLINCVAKHKREQPSFSVDHETGEVLEFPSNNVDSAFVDEPINTRLPFNVFYAEIGNKKSNVAESEPHAPENRDYKLPWEEDKDDSEAIDIDSIVDSIFDKDVHPSHSSDNTQETEEQRRKRIADVWGFDPDEPDSIKYTRSVLQSRKPTPTRTSSNNAYAIDDEDLY